MKVFFVVTVARQVEGDMVSVKFEKAFTQASKADEYCKNLSKVYTESVTTPDGLIQFMCQRGVHEIELEEETENV